MAAIKEIVDLPSIVAWKGFRSPPGPSSSFSDLGGLRGAWQGSGRDFAQEPQEGEEAHDTGLQLLRSSVHAAFLPMQGVLAWARRGAFSLPAHLKAGAFSLPAHLKAGFFAMLERSPG
jgi:hypothetical protein